MVAALASVSILRAVLTFFQRRNAVIFDAPLITPSLRLFNAPLLTAATIFDEGLLSPEIFDSPVLFGFTIPEAHLLSVLIAVDAPEQEAA
jgi:hypothetical protein